MIRYITATNDDMELLMSSSLKMLKVVNNLPDDYQFSKELVTYSKEYFEKGDQTTILAVDDETGNVEASFSSKMLATIHPNMPIWDQYVLKRLNLTLEGTTKEKKLENAIVIYNQIVTWYETALREEKLNLLVQKFREIVKSYELSDVKVLDFIMWGTREN